MCLERLQDDLQQSGNEAHLYISSLLAELTLAENSNQVNPLLEQIKSSAKMIEYANFNQRQEALGMDMWNEASRLLQSN